MALRSFDETIAGEICSDLNNNFATAFNDFTDRLSRGEAQIHRWGQTLRSGRERVARLASRLPSADNAGEQSKRDEMTGAAAILQERFKTHEEAVAIFSRLIAEGNATCDWAQIRASGGTNATTVV